MTDTSTESNDNLAEPVAPQDKATDAKAKVPVEAIAKERADKRAARAEVEKLKDQLAKAQENKEIDVQSMIESFGPHITDMVTTAAAQAAEAAVKPYRDELEIRKTAMSLGLNEEQAGALAKLKAETPGLTDARALAILRVEDPNLFGSGRTGIPVTGFAPSGDSPFRTQAPKEDFMAKMQEAVKNQDQRLATEYATRELHRRITAARQRG